MAVTGFPSNPFFSPFPDLGRTADDDVVALFNQPEGQDWRDHPSLFRQTAAMNGDPNLPVAACHSAGVVEQFGKGFASYPQGLAAVLLQITMEKGLWGEVQKRHASIRGHQLSGILWLGLQDTDRTMRLLWWLTKNALPKDAPYLAGRFGGGTFTGWALKLGRLGKAWPLGVVPMFVLAGYGSGILAMERGNIAFDAIAYAILSGRYEGICLPADRIKRELQDMENKEGPEIAPMVQMLKDVMRLAQGAGNN
ncbi:hypothetical protein FBZ89_14216 [Nitrospirillum amazonense]|uniref:Uncharacterized protein n=1 Tax=Nitrospirillum amazonense TaxID=28077 RepID=A0A560EIZ6_9PROT|nr:hypothetical protein [Nitrospirillum amazonense]TWB09332.1 hypothetical protein FBZ89_14216 [Nitrospirillum amazonense]